jgi:hypothetical protein
MGKLVNLARMTTPTVGTGTITLGAAASGFLTFAQAGVLNGDIVSYGIKDGVDSEVGTGTYTSSGTTMTRTPIKSTQSDAAISLSGTAEVYITALREDLLAATAAEYLANSAPTKLLTPGAAWSAAAYVTVNDTQAAAGIDLNSGFDFLWSISGAGKTMANPQNATKIGQKGIVYLVQGVASATITTWGSNWKFPGGTKPTLSTAANAVDIVSYVVGSGNTLYCTFSAGFA